MTSKSNIYGVLVSYQPSNENVNELIRTSKSFNKLVVVDNGSKSNILKRLRVVSKSSKIDLILNYENLGLDKATNIGIKNLQITDNDWVMILDQDSVLTSNLPKKMIEFYNSLDNNLRSEIVILSPNINNFDNGLEIFKDRFEFCDEVIASGMLIKGEYLKNNLFSEEYFIDCVDIDYSWTARTQNKRIIKIRDTILVHSMGSNAKTKFLGKEINLSGYSPIRRYYITRNNLTLLRKFRYSFWKKAIKRNIHEFKNLIKIIIFESKKIDKIKFTLLGILDFLNCKKGKFGSLDIKKVVDKSTT